MNEPAKIGKLILLPNTGQCDWHNYLRSCAASTPNPSVKVCGV